MLMLLIDAVILMGLISAVQQMEMEFMPAMIFCLVASILSLIVAVLLISALGDWGLILAAIISAIRIGLGVSYVLGAELKRSILIGVLFIVIHVAVSMTLDAIFTRREPVACGDRAPATYSTGVAPGGGTPPPDLT